MTARQQVYRYPLQNQSGVQEVPLPPGARAIHFGSKFNKPQLWALVTPSAPERDIRHFEIVGTGQTLQGIVVAHVGSVQLLGQSFIFHLFEVTPREENSDG